MSDQRFQNNTNYLQNKILKNSYKKKYKENFVVGFKKGQAKGTIEIAKNLLSQNIDINTISTATALSIAEIEKLKDQVFPEIFIYLVIA